MYMYIFNTSHNCRQNENICNNKFINNIYLNDTNLVVL